MLLRVLSTPLWNICSFDHGTISLLKCESRRSITDFYSGGITGYFYLFSYLNVLAVHCRKISLDMTSTF